MNAGLKVFALGMVASVATFTSSEEVYAAAIRVAASCSYADVSAAVTAAAVGDTVSVPVGNCAWSSMLNINKGISLIGAGVAKTVISGTNGLISYSPSNGSTNAVFRLSGFTFNFGNSSAGMDIESGATTTLQTKVRIDHNRFENSSAQYLHMRGFRGVVDNNVFGSTAYPLRFEYGAFNDGGRTEWNNFEGIELGKPDNNVWFENNTFEGVSDILVDCQVGNRYAFRYNNIHLTASVYPLMDMHGNQPSEFYSCFGGELYGNNITGGQGGTLLDQRGGRAFVFNNNVTAGMSIQIREEYADSIDPVNYVGPNPPQLPQRVSGSYYWGNRINLTGSLLTPFINSSCSQCGENGLAAGANFFYEGSSPAATCGTPANRPSSCSKGQGYWATNQSCTNLTGMVGANPATPIAGTLYRCIATNTWDSGASPLPFPHPLTGAAAAPDLPPPFLHQPVSFP